MPEPREAQLPFLLLVDPAVRPDPQSPGPLHSAKGPYVEAKPGPRILPQLLESLCKALLNVLLQAGQLALCGATDEDPDQRSQPQTLTHVLPV